MFLSYIFFRFTMEENFDIKMKQRAFTRVLVQERKSLMETIDVLCNVYLEVELF